MKAPSTMPDLDDPTPASASLPRGALGAWWRQGARSALFMRPDWRGLAATPLLIAVLVAVPYALGVAVQRLYIDGPATFYWPALQMGWLPTAVIAWICWLLAPRSNGGAPSAAALFAMLAAQSLAIGGVLALLMVPLVRAGLWPLPGLGLLAAWALWSVPMAWIVAAQLTLVWRAGSGSPALKTGAMLVLAATLVSGEWDPPLRPWYPDEPVQANAAAAQPMRLTQEQIEQQPRLLDERLQALQPQRPGVVDVYTIAFAPYADEDVFRREAEMVAGVMDQRFGSAGRSVRLVNHRETIRQWPWATPLNLQRTIQRMAALMNRDEDLLFIHLTSHGAQGGTLSARFWPLSIDEVTPQALKGWLDEAGVRYRIVSVSACYSGSWIAPLSDPATLVMTAADAEHTSYGCGKRSELTFFGRAMFDEQLRRTWSFEQAHAAARAVIDQREREAGKTDGPSNPQIHVGAQIRPQLARLAAERAKATPPARP
ncbi:MAG TPA: C13 family peptidase [Albitalea sp.]|nr:C13 family peptidase [Albitalea sp.]